MPTYITLVRYTQEGAQKMKESPARLDAAKEVFKAMGAELKAYYLTMGQYDAVVIGEAPDDETPIAPVYRFGPDGFTFARPITIGFPAPDDIDLTKEVLSIWRINPSSGVLEEYPAKYDVWNAGCESRRFNPCRRQVFTIIRNSGRYFTAGSCFSP